MATGSLMGVVGLAAVLLGFACAALFASLAVTKLRRSSARNSARLGAQGTSSDTAFLHAMRNGVPFLQGVAALFLKFEVISQYVEGVSEWLDHAKGITCPKESAASLLLAMVLLLGGAGTVVAENPIAGIAADALVIVVVATRVSAWRERELDALRDGVPTALNVMGECFQSGYSLLQTMTQVSEQSEGRLASLFARCADVLKLGGTSREALECLREEECVSELSFVAVALDVQHQAGGSVVSVLSNAQRMVADEIELRRSLQVQTAQARLSARVVCIMPFVLVAVLSVLSEGFMSAFFESAAGVAMLCAALVMQASGVLLVRKMLKVAQ